ncbi:hypothetical protein Xekk_04055 [Xenorhabdus sp. KK7.4]|nr:hypothetical protein Xekk_04055 [Xenorhabdus sp. KK7.4]
MNIEEQVIAFSLENPHLATGTNEYQCAAS